MYKVSIHKMCEVLQMDLSVYYCYASRKEDRAYIRKWI